MIVCTGHPLHVHVYVLIHVYTGYMPMCVYGMYVHMYLPYVACMYMYVCRCTYVCMYVYHTDLSRHLVSDFSAIQDLMAVGNTHR